MISNEHMYIENVFPSELIPNSILIQNSLTSYSQKQISVFAQNIVTILDSKKTDLTPELLIWSLHVIPFNFIMDSEQFVQKTIVVYKRLLDSIPFKPEIGELNEYVSILLIHLSLLFNQAKYSAGITKMAEHISKGIITKGEFSLRTKLIGIHLLLQSCITLKNTENFIKIIGETFDCLLKMLDSFDYKQFDDKFDRIFGNEIFDKFSPFFCKIVKHYMTDKEKYKAIYHYFYDKISNCTDYNFKHKMFIEVSHVYTLNYLESRSNKSFLKIYSIENFKSLYFDWFSPNLVFSYNPKYLFDFAFYGIDEESHELSHFIQESIIERLEHLSNESQLAICELISSICPFVFKYPDFIGTENFVTHIFNSRQFFYSLATVPDSSNNDMITILSSVYDVTNSKYLDEIKSLIPKIIEKIIGKIGTSHDNVLTCALLLHLLLQIKDTTNFWNLVQKVENKVQPAIAYGSISPLIYGNDFKKNPKISYTGYIIRNQEECLTFKIMALNMITFAVSTSYFEENSDEFSNFVQVLSNRENSQWDDIKFLCNVFKQAVSCGGFPQEQTEINSSKSVDFSTSTSIISAIDNNTLVFRNIIGAIKSTVVHLPNTKSDDDEFDLPVPENDDSIDLHIPTLPDGTQPSEYKNYLSHSDFAPYSDFKVKEVSNVMKLLRSSHLFSFGQHNTRYLSQNRESLVAIDKIPTTSTLKIAVRRISSNSSEFSNEMSSDYEEFLNSVKSISLKPICDKQLITDGANIDNNHIMIIFNESNFQPNLESISEKRSLIVHVKKVENFYLLEMLRVPKDAKVFIPFNESTRMLLSFEKTAELLNLIIYAFYSTIPDLFLTNLKKRAAKLEEIFQSLVNANVAPFPAFYDI